MKKKGGFTLAELIIAVAITLTLILITFAMFEKNTKVSSEVTIKSDLQDEAGKLFTRLSNSGMQASGISELTLAEGTEVYISTDPIHEKRYGDSDFKFVDETGKENTVDKSKNQWISIKKITINKKIEVPVDYESTGVKYTSFDINYNKYPDGNKYKGAIVINEGYYDSGTNDIIIKTDDPSSPFIPKDIEGVLIRPSNLFYIDDQGKQNINPNGQLSKASAIDVTINLGRQRGVDDLHYSLHSTVTFRNKT